MLRSVKYGLYGAVLAGLVGGSAVWLHVDKSVTLVVDGTRSELRTTAAQVSDVLRQAGYAAGPHDLVAPATHDAVHDGSTVVLRRGRLLRLSIDGDARDVWTTAPTVAVAMRQLGLSSANFTSVSRSRRLPLGVTNIAVRTPKAVTVDHDGIAQQVTTTDETVGQLMDTMGITLATTDRLSREMSAPLVNDMQIVVTRVVNTTSYTTSTVKFDTVHKADSALPAGTVKVATRGRDGVRRTTYALVYIDGQLAGRSRISTAVVTRPVTRVEQVGTGTQTLAVGGSSTGGSSGSSGGRSSGGGSSGGGSSAPIHVNPGSAQAIARTLLEQRGWGDAQFSCLDEMWSRESGWRVNAANPSGAYGIPQALPGSKMASAGPDWRSNPTTQIKWGLGYISSRYGTPCGAWSQWQANGGWYY